MALTKYDLTRGNTSSTWFTFARAVATAEPTGDLVAVNVPRWGFPKSIAGLWGEEEALDELGGRDRIKILAGGYDSTTGASPNPLIVTQEAGNRKLRFSWAPDMSKVVGRVFYGCSSLSGAVPISGPDIRSLRSATGNRNDNSCFIPQTGVVCFGTIIVICAKHEFIGGAWIPTGTAVAVSTESLSVSVSEGPEFTIFYDDTVNSSPINSREPRLNTWACTGWYCPWYSGDLDERPEEVIIPFVDYQSAPGSTATPIAEGGRAYWFKLKLSSTTGKYEPVQASGGGPAMAVLELPATGLWDPPFGATGARPRYMHIHAAGVTEYGEEENGKWQVVVASGDEANSMIRVIVNDTSDTGFHIPSNWTVIDNWHGTIDTAIRTPPTAGGGTALDNNGNAGNQFVGVGPGPTPGTLLLGGDAVGEGSWILTPGSSTTSTPSHETFIGSAGARVTRPASFHIRADRADLEARTILMDETRSIVYNGQIPTNGDASLNKRLALNDYAFSWESGAQGSWGFVPQTGYEQNAFVIGDYIYLATIRISGSNSIVRRELPVIVTGEPLQIGPGGRQWLIDDPRIYQFENATVAKVVPCTQDSGGIWYEMPMTGSALSALDPQPPVKANAVFRVTKVRTVPATRICYFGPTLRDSSSDGALPTGQTLPLGLRMWIRSNSARQADTPQCNYPSPKRSCSSGPLWLAWDAGSSAGNYVALGDYSIVGDTARWQCLTEPFRGSINSNSEEKFVLRSGPYGAGAASDADTDIYLAFSEFCQFGTEDSTNGYAAVDTFGYPLPAATYTSPVSILTVYPPEKAVIDHTFPASFTLFFAGIMPEDSWDQYTRSASDGIPTLPLLTIQSGDAAKFLTINAHPGSENSGHTDFVASYSITSQSGGPTETLDSTPFLRGRGLIGAVSYDESDDTARIYLCHNGRYIGEAKLVDIGWTSVDMKKIRFGNHVSTDLARVGTFQWLGIAVDTELLDEEAVLEKFRTLEFL